MSLTLRDYQSRAIHDLRLAYRSGARAPLLVAATGCGKTVIFAAITAGAVDRGRRVLILVHRRELIRQASAKLTHAGVTHGIIAAGFEPSDHPVQVASVQTLARRLERQAWQPDLIVIDEAHHSVAGTWGSVLNHWPEAYLLGVTATPVRRDGRGLSAVFDRLVLGPSVHQLTAERFLTEAQIYAPASALQLSKIRVRSGDYAPEDAAAALDKPTITGDAIEHYQRLGRGCSAIAFCCTTAHAEHVSAQFRSCGIRSHVVLGTTPVEEREQLIDDLGTGKLQVLVSVDVISEGTDVPSVGAAILLRPTQSEGLYLQQVGRVLRPAPGKTHALILDHVGNVHRHGFPDDHREWSLDDARRRTGKGGPPAPAVRTCPQCFAAFKPAPVCPVCGTECAASQRELKQVDGELVEVNRSGHYVGATVSVKLIHGEWSRASAHYGNWIVAELSGDERFVTVALLDRRGAVAETELLPVENVKITRRGANRERRAAQRQARTLTDLIQVGIARGMKNPAGWARHVYFARQQRS